MSATSTAPNAYARAERNALCDLLQHVGPEQPTLCEGWRTRDLAAHLVVREGRNIIVSAGITLPALSGITAKAQRKAGARPWLELIEAVRTGPPRGSVMRSEKLDGTINTIEFFVHHEDVRRAQAGWEPRALSPEFAEDLFSRLGQFGKRLVRKSTVGVVGRHTDGREVVLNDGPSPVTITGDPGEILMCLYRRDHARVTLGGDPASIATLHKALGG